MTSGVRQNTKPQVQRPAVSESSLLFATQRSMMSKRTHPATPELLLGP